MPRKNEYQFHFELITKYAITTATKDSRRRYQ